VITYGIKPSLRVIKQFADIALDAITAPRAVEGVEVVADSANTTTSDVVLDRTCSTKKSRGQIRLIHNPLLPQECHPRLVGG